MKLSRRSFFLSGIAAVAIAPAVKANPYDKWWEDELVPYEPPVIEPVRIGNYVQIFRREIQITCLIPALNPPDLSWFKPGPPLPTLELIGEDMLESFE